MNSRRPPGGPARSPHTPGFNDRELLGERVKQEFKGFDQPEREPESESEPELDESELLADDWVKPTLQLLAGVFAASLLGFFAASPTFETKGVWANSFRFDTTFVVLWGPILVWAMSKLRLEYSLRIYLALSLFIEPFSEAMMRDQGDGYWDTVMWPADIAWYGTIKEWGGVPGASLPVFFFVSVGLLYRAVWGKKTEDHWAPPRFARSALLTFLGAVVGLAVWGIAHGGDVSGTFRQTTHLLQLPIIGLVFLYALRVPEDLAAVGSIYVVTALVRSLLVMYVYFGVCVPQGITERPGYPEWCTTHSDSVLFVTSILIVLTHAFEQRTNRTILRALGVSAVLLFAIVLNNRRLAFVSLMIAPAIIYLALKPSRRKRRVTSALMIAVPVAVLYILIGAEINSTTPLLKPAKLVMSVLDQKDLSSLSRDVENENLIYTMRQSPLVSTGFGFNYQYSPNNPPVDLSEVFIDYRLIAHNGVLWLWSLGGVVGFTLLWMIFPIAGTLAMRGYRSARSALERSAALTALGAVAICIVQVWGDQGLNGYITPITLGVAFAVATRLAVGGSRAMA